jgi:3-dehydroquinate dehydratase
MEEIKINFGQLRSLEKSLETQNSEISRKALQDMVDIVINSPRNEVKQTVAYRTLLDLDIISISHTSEPKQYDKPTQLNS